VTVMLVPAARCHPANVTTAWSWPEIVGTTSPVHIPADSADGPDPATVLTIGQLPRSEWTCGPVSAPTDPTDLTTRKRPVNVPFPPVGNWPGVCELVARCGWRLVHGLPRAPVGPGVT
jgi:hypothetical protein